MARDHDFLWAADEPAGWAAGFPVQRGAVLPGRPGEPLRARSVLPQLGGQRRVGRAEPGAGRFALAGPQDAWVAVVQRALTDELAGRALVLRFRSKVELPDGARLARSLRVQRASVGAEEQPEAKGEREALQLLVAPARA
ncbi:MAG TPA: hypothetical protein VFA13_04780 [Candidatus Acidoferrum sp.]|nr:hypothetical protein [Candidatus Acidoferrum sp.]